MNMNILTALVFLTFFGKTQVAALTLSIRFQDIGSYDYNGGKAYMKGDAMKLICEASNGELQDDHRIVYTKDGTKITSDQTVLVPNPGDHYIVIHNKLSSTLQQYQLFIAEVSEEDQGLYHCQVETSTGVLVVNAQFNQLPGNSPQVTVLYLPDSNRYPECIIEEGTIDVKVGSSLTLKCTSETGNPPVALSWKRDSGESSGLEDVTSSVTTTDGVIHNNAEPIIITADHDGDKFQCFMTPSKTFFPTDLRNCQVGPLNVINDLGVTLPVIEPSVQTAMTGDAVNFQCSLEGQSDAVFEWSWDPNWVFEKQPVSPDTRSFTLRNVQTYHHMTKVFCKTTSQGVEVSVYGLIRVNGPYVAPSVTPLPPETVPSGGGNNGVTDSNGGNGDDKTNGINTNGINPISTTRSVGDSGMTTSSGHGIMNRKADIRLVLITGVLLMSLLVI